MSSADLVTRTQELLATRSRTDTYAVIATQTGVPRRTLESIARRERKDYPCRAVQVVYEYLAKRPLELV